MKVADIRIGEQYAARIHREEISVAGLDPDNPFAVFTVTGILYSAASVRLGHELDHRAGEWKAVEAVAVEKRGPRTWRVLVEGEYERPRVEYRREDHLDGTFTEWRGHVLRDDGEDGEPVMDTFTYQAVIPPNRLLTIEDATASLFSRKLDRDLRRLAQGHTP